MLRFDVAENATDFAWAGDPELVDGLPAGRTAFMTQGYIYPEGTLTEDNGVNPDGSPEFPDKVLGQWSCWGWYLGTEAPAGTARWLTTHLVSFGDDPGGATLVERGLQHRRHGRRAGAGDRRRDRPVRRRPPASRSRPTSASTPPTASTSATRSASPIRSPKLRLS